MMVRVAKANIPTVTNRRKPFKIENRIYTWLLQEEEHLHEGNDVDSLEEFKRLGVPWRSSSLFDDSSETPPNLSVSASKAIGRLRDRGMIETAGSTDPQKQHRSSHLKLTLRGYVKAFQIASKESGNRQVPKLTLKVVQRSITEDIHRLEDLDESAKRFLKATSSAKSRLSLHFDRESTEFSQETLKQIAELADEARKLRILELRSYLRQLVKLKHGQT